MGKRTLFGTIVLLALLLGLTALSGCGKTEEVSEEPELSVNVVKAATRDLAQAVTYTGLVRGQREVYITPKVPARVTGIHVSPGDSVRQGQVLLTLDNTDFIAAIKQAEAAVAMAEANKQSNDLQREIARKNYERMQELHAAGAVSDQQLETARAQFEALASGAVEAALEQARAGLLQARTQYNNTVITSPITGTVGSINLSLGDTANPQAVAAIVSDTAKLEIEIQVTEAEISYIEAGAEVQVFIRAVRETPYTGKVVSVATVADPVKRSYPVKVELDNEKGEIKSGMFAEVVMATISKQDVVSVPASAVVPKGGRTLVYVVDQENRAREREVETGISDGTFVEIVKGLAPGETVITKGNTLVNDGSLVRVVTGGEQ